MGRPHPLELRERVVWYVERGHSHRAVARRFMVSVRFVNNMVILKRKTGCLAPKRQGNLGWGKLTGHEDWVRDRVVANGDLTLEALRDELAERGVEVHVSSVARLLQRLGFSHKKKCFGPRAVAA